MFTETQLKRLDVLKMTLSKIYLDEYLSKYLIFKGGTSMMLFYWLRRFSEDLDFSLLPWFDKNEINQRINRIISELWFRVEKYENTKHLSVWKTCYYEIDGVEYELKLEISNREYTTPLRWVIESIIYWNKRVSINLLDISHNFAHKLCAFFDRWRWRDTVDVFHYLQHNSPIESSIIIERLWMTVDEAFESYIATISNIENRKWYIREIASLINNDEILISWYYLDMSINMIMNWWYNVVLFSDDDIVKITDRLNNVDISQIWKSFYVVKNTNWFSWYFQEAKYFWIMDFNLSRIIFESDNIFDIQDFIKSNQSLFI